MLPILTDIYYYSVKYYIYNRKLINLFLTINLIIPIYIITTYSTSYYGVSGKLFLCFFWYTFITLSDLILFT